jgi:hypothetical protein
MHLTSKLVSTLLISSGLILSQTSASFASWGNKGDPQNKNFSKFENEEKDRFLETKVAGNISNIKNGNYQAVSEDIVRALISDKLLPSIGKNAPDWAKRIELEYDYNYDYDSNEIDATGSILTTQPIFQSDDKQHTLFTQVRASYADHFGYGALTTNIGVGYRELLLDNKVLLGTNVFYDRKFDFKHERLGVGLELKFGGLDLNMNHYNAVSGEKQRTDSKNGTYLEQALDGYDFEIGSQIPFLPWSRLYYKKYFWDGVRANDIKGDRFALELDLTPNFQVEGGYAKDNATGATVSDENIGSAFVKVRFRLAFGYATPKSNGKFIDDRAFRMRDMSNHTLDKVRRQDKIIVERRKAGATIGNGAVVVVRDDA